MKTASRSWWVCWGCALFLVIVAYGYYPKWQMKRMEATISWDVSGYYWYLPSLFIYKDIRQQTFAPDIIAKYAPSPDFQQAFRHESGNYVLKYSGGLALQFLPFFAVAHAVAPVLGYPADGFSLPYQVAIHFGGLCVAIIGLWLLRRVLLYYFSDTATAATLAAITFATNFLEYSAITNAMTHNWLFAVYAWVLYATIRFYQRPHARWALGIGLACGLAMLTRPTEFVIILLPLLWGVGSVPQLRERGRFIGWHWRYYALSAVVGAAVGAIQLLYWKYATGHWLVYSYQDQTFSWLRPHFIDGLFSARAGWLIYTPIMALALWGLVPLWRKRMSSAGVITLFILLFSYITFAWDIWWYGGSLGQRAMVQAYAVAAFPLAAAIEALWQRCFGKWIFGGLFLMCTYYNLWLTHQAHRGGLLYPGDMTKAYFLKVLGRYSVPPETVKLLDTKEDYTGVRKNVKVIFTNDVEKDTSSQAAQGTINGARAWLINDVFTHTPTADVPLSNGAAEWVRVSAWVKATQKEWDMWKMAYLVLQFRKGDTVVQERSIRLHRLLHDGETKRLHLDARLPKKSFDALRAYGWNGGGKQALWLDDLTIELFDSE